MKKVFLALALVTVLVSCNQVRTTEVSTEDTTVVVETAQDTVTVDTATAK